MEHQEGFPIEIYSDGGDETSLRIKEDTPVLVVMESAVRVLFPETAVPVTSYTLKVDTVPYELGSWNGKTVHDLKIHEHSDLMVYGPSPKG